MIQVTPQMRIVAAVEPVDFRCGIDGLARLCKETLKHDPFNGWVAETAFWFADGEDQGRRWRRQGFSAAVSTGGDHFGV